MGTLVFCMAGCASLSGSEVSSSPTVAVLINRTWLEDDPRGLTWEVRKDERDTEEQFAACVRTAASSKGVSVRAITGTEFRAAVFSDLDPRSAPRKLETLRSLIPEPRFQERIQAAKIDYLAIVGGETRTSETKGGVGCAGGGPAAVCLGLLWWDHESRLSALILDMRRGEGRLTQGIDVAGRSWFALFQVLPIAAPSLHEARGCERFGNAVASALTEMHREGD
jgi:hypothetical protein